MTIGVLGSGGGSSWAEADRVLMDLRPGWLNWCVATDRPCGLEVMADGVGAKRQRFEDADGGSLSLRVADWFGENACDLALLFFARLVGPALWMRLPVLNVHPSLLPAFPGFGAVRAAARQGARFLGATLHVVDGSPDAGPIVAQVCAPMAPWDSTERLERVSFLQKAYLAALAVDLVASEAVSLKPGEHPVWRLRRPSSLTCSPQLGPDLHRAFVKLQREHEVEGVFGEESCVRS